MQCRAQLRRGGPQRASGPDEAGAQRMHDAGDRGARQQQQRREEEEQRDHVGSQALDRGRGGRVQRLPHDPAARLDERAAPLVRVGPAGPEPERSGRERKREGGEQAQRAGGERAAVRQERPQHDDGPAGDQRGRHDVRDHADEVAEAVRERSTDLTPVPVPVEDECQEHPERDQREPDDVQLALLEHRQAQPQARAVAAGGAALRGLPRRLPGGLRPGLLARGHRGNIPSTATPATLPGSGVMSPASALNRRPERGTRKGALKLPREEPDSPYHRRTMNDFARPPRVLVVEDDDEIALALQRSLRMEGYDVRLAEDGVDALDQAHAFLPDVVLLDLGLPKLDGIEVAKELRKREDDVGILMLTARDGLDDRVAGLDTGADDYLVKPFERQELLARMRALLRRRPPRGSAPLVMGDLRLNPDTHEVARGDRAIDLTQREFELLEYLMRNERIVVSRQRLLDEVWGYDPFSITNTIEVFVSNLRRKLEADGEPRLLHTIRGAGYVLRV